MTKNFKTNWVMIGSLGSLMMTTACSPSATSTGSPEAHEVTVSGIHYLALRGVDDLNSPPASGTHASGAYASMSLTAHEPAVVSETAKSICQFKGFQEVDSYKKADLPSMTDPIHYIYPTQNGQFVDYGFTPVPELDSVTDSGKTYTTQVFTSLKCSQKISDPLTAVPDTDLDQVEEGIQVQTQDFESKYIKATTIPTLDDLDLGIKDANSKFDTTIAALKTKQDSKQEGHLRASWVLKTPRLNVVKPTLETLEKITTHRTNVANTSAELNHFKKMEVLADLHVQARNLQEEPATSQIQWFNEYFINNVETPLTDTTRAVNQQRLANPDAFLGEQFNTLLHQIKYLEKHAKSADLRELAKAELSNIQNEPWMTASQDLSQEIQKSPNSDPNTWLTLLEKAKQSLDQYPKEPTEKQKTIQENLLENFFESAQKFFTSINTELDDLVTKKKYIFSEEGRERLRQIIKITRITDDYIEEIPEKYKSNWDGTKKIFIEKIQSFISSITFFRIQDYTQSAEYTKEMENSTLIKILEKYINRVITSELSLTIVLLFKDKEPKDWLSINECEFIQNDFRKQIASPDFLINLVDHYAQKTKEPSEVSSAKNGFTCIAAKELSRLIVELRNFIDDERLNVFKSLLENTIDTIIEDKNNLSKNNVNALKEIINNHKNQCDFTEDQVNSWLEKISSHADDSSSP